VNSDRLIKTLRPTESTVYFSATAAAAAAVKAGFHWLNTRYTPSQGRDRGGYSGKLRMWDRGGMPKPLPIMEVAGGKI